MGNSLRCCLACVLPCGALDLIRIVHLNGYVEELTGPITAGQALKDHPNHVLSKPSSQGMVRRILILSSESELKRGSIYFLIPSSSVPEKKKIRNLPTKSPSKMSKSTSSTGTTTSNASVADCDTQHLTEVVTSEKEYDNKSFRRDRRRGRVGIWRPHLQSISED